MNKLTLLVFLLVISVLSGQNGVPFTTNKQFYLKGNSFLIGNNIVSTHHEKPYTGDSFNDVLELEYIDVDDDKDTFSSSTAVLETPEKEFKIKYAALYWSAIYKYDKGFTVVRKLSNNTKRLFYEGNNERAKNVNSVLFKTPNSTTYSKINGEVIYDSFNNEKAFPDIKPYVCYADVTSIMQNLNGVNGSYTVANIRATEGLIAGGAAGGWLLYVIYEDDSKPKFFTTYNGFTDVFKEPVDIIFRNFKTPEFGEIKVSLLLGALEGDHKFKTDICSFHNYKTKEYVPLFNRVRPRLNFFNSSITINEKQYTNRIPNSKNTLGFDLLKMEIPNSDNNIITNKMTQTIARFNSKADRYYLFFMAFETEIDSIFLENQQNKTKEVSNNSSSFRKLVDTSSIQQRKLVMKSGKNTDYNNHMFDELKKEEDIEIKEPKPFLGKATDQITKSLVESRNIAENSNIEQKKLLVKLNESIDYKKQILDELKKENDLRDKGTFITPKNFKSTSANNAKLKSVKLDLDNIIKSQGEKITQLELIYKKRLKKFKDKNNTDNKFFSEAIENLKASQAQTIITRDKLISKLEKINVATEIEKKKRIKLANYTSQEDRFLKDRAALERIKNSTPLSSIPSEITDFDFGEKQNNNIQIIKGNEHIKSGYYIVIAVHSSEEKRDEFLKKVVALGETNVDFFYNLTSNKYFIYCEKYDNISEAQRVINTKQNKPYNKNMSLVKVES